MNIGWLVDRVNERSTWVGVLAFIAALGYEFTPEMAEAITTYCLGVGGLLLVATKD